LSSRQLPIRLLARIMKERSIEGGDMIRHKHTNQS
jgi:hypothetical protein